MRSILGSRFYYKGAWLLSALALCQAAACYGQGDEATDDAAGMDDSSEVASVQQFLGAAPGTAPLSGENVAAGGDFTLFLHPNGSLWAWGRRSEGQTGTGIASTSHKVPVQVPGLPPIKAIAAGRWHALAVDDAGHVWGWGNNGNGQVGNGSFGSTPQATPFQVPGLSNITAVAAGDYFSVALDADGAIWSWGSNPGGQMGNGTSGSNVLVPVKITIEGGAAGISAGGSHTLVVSKTGAVWAWGATYNGQIGNGSMNGSGTYQRTPYKVALGAGNVAVAVAAGHTHSLALLSDGSLLAWGSNNNGQLGIGNTSQKSLPQAVPGLTGITQITGGWDFTFARSSSGAVWAWGSDSTSQLGDGDSVYTFSLSPKAIPGLNALVLSAGIGHAVALGADCTVQTWGRNTSGEIGNGTSSSTTYVKSPTPVLPWARPTYADVDGDGFGDPDAASGQEACIAPPGYAVNRADCDDADGIVHPGAAETCNGVDDDCDASVDEGDPGGGEACTTEEPGVCSPGTTQCSAGSIVCNRNVEPSDEVCDGVDNNCDGSGDENNPGGGVACSTGQPGVCSPGTTQCAASQLGCIQNVQPSDDICDGLDNNCDGSVDESNPGGGVACSTGQPGVCVAGTTQCSAGAIVCNRSVAPSADVCDGRDNNCDGNVDENNPGGGIACATGQPGVCNAGTTQCADGAIVCNQNVAPSAEVCDGIDNNCDGNVDEGNPGGGIACATGQPGVCNAGTTQCAAGALVCNQNVASSAEVCDGLDNDCDGSVDEGVTSTFYRDNDGDGFGTPSQTTAACSAPAGYVSNASDCNDGSAWVHPGQEDDCNGVDNDCDGLTDEDFDSTPCSSPICSAGGNTKCSVTGHVYCYVNVQTLLIEPCDGEDNDCDGAVDEGCLLDP